MMKRLLLLFAVIVGLQFAKAAEPVEVTDQYLSNVSAPFETTGESILNDNNRWQRLAAPWVTKNGVGFDSEWADSGETIWHVDFDKTPMRYDDTAGRAGVITITPGWDGFLGTFSNNMVYQVTTLPAGQYELIGRLAQDVSGVDNAYMVVSKGAEGLNNIEDLDNALGSVVFASYDSGYNISVLFKLDEETEVSIGFIASYESAKACVTIGDIHLYTYAGANFKGLQAQITAANAIKVENYPFGTLTGMYSEAKWNALQDVIAAAEAFVEASIDDTETPQDDVDAHVQAIKDAINELNASMVLPFRVSDDSNEYWYQIRDNRDTKSYWRVGELTYTDEESGEVTEYPLALIMSQESDNDSDEQLFKLVKAEAPSKGYYIVNRMFGDDLPAEANIGANVVEFGEEGSTWLFGRGYDALHFIVFTEEGNNQLNSYATYEPQKIAFYNYVNDHGNNWEFLQLVEDGQTDFNELIALVVKAVAMNESKYPVGTGEAEYSEEAWETFVIARTQAYAMAETANTDNEASQEEVDAMIELLQSTIDALLASQNPPFFLSDDENEHWYTISDRRATSTYWFLDKLDEEFEDVTIRGLKGHLGLPEEGIAEDMLFKFVKPENDFLNGVYIFCKDEPDFALSGDNAENGFIGVDDFLEETTWVIEQSPFADRFIIYHENEDGELGMQVNSYAGAGKTAPFIISYWDDISDIGNQWLFTPATVTVDVKDVKPSELNVYVVNRTIITSNPADKLEVYSVNGQRMNAKQQLPQGVYVVRIEGKAGAAKVVVR